jgi:hypothetical protein
MSGGRGVLNGSKRQGSEGTAEDEGCSRLMEDRAKWMEGKKGVNSKKRKTIIEEIVPKKNMTRSSSRLVIPAETEEPTERVESTTQQEETPVVTQEPAGEVGLMEGIRYNGDRNPYFHTRTNIGEVGLMEELGTMETKPPTSTQEPTGRKSQLREGISLKNQWGRTHSLK